MIRRPAIAPSAKTRGSSTKDGFLLVEALATMTISAFLLVALASVVSLMLRASDRAGRASQEIEDSSRIIASLSREIEQAVPLRFAGDGGGFVFNGNDRGLTFARETVLADGTADLRAVILQNEGHRLMLAEAPLLPGDRSMDDLVAGPAKEMARGRFVIRFAYFSGLDTGEETLTDAWTRSDVMPVAVRVSVTDGTGAAETSARVQLRVDAEPGCAAPGRGICSFVKKTGDVEGTPESDTPPEAQAPVDPDDALGWARYIR